MYFDAEQFRCDAVKRVGDPTGTLDIRRRFRSMLQMRFRKVRSLLQQAVIAQDLLGLKPGSVSPVAMATTPGNRELAFQTWLDGVLRQIVVEDGAWMVVFMRTAYDRAITRAMRLTNSNAQPTDMVETINALSSLALIELQGIVEAVSQRIVRVAALAFLHGQTPKQAFGSMDEALNKVGIVRGNAMIELMVIKAFTTGTLDQFEAASVKQVGLVPELLPVRDVQDAPRRFSGPGSRISRKEAPSRSTIYRIRRAQREVEKLRKVNVETAGDDKVCPICEDIEEDNPYTIDQARSLIPAHPNCRCAFVPVGSFGNE